MVLPSRMRAILARITQRIVLATTPRVKGLRCTPVGAGWPPDTAAAARKTRYTP